MQGELWLKACQLEGCLFKLHVKLDKATNLNEYIMLQKEIFQTRTTLEMYQNCINEFQKQEALKKIKRKMRR